MNKRVFILSICCVMDCVTYAMEYKQNDTPQSPCSNGINKQTRASLFALSRLHNNALLTPQEMDAHDFFSAVFNGEIGTVQNCVESKGVPVNGMPPKCLLDYQINAAPALMLALRQGHVVIADYLLKHGADAKILSEQDGTTVHALIRGCLVKVENNGLTTENLLPYLKVLKKLIKGGADPNLRVPAYPSPLEILSLEVVPHLNNLDIKFAYEEVCDFLTCFLRKYGAK